jgi:DNA modification methylase
MRYLVRLVTPPDGVVLDPFLGSGTTGCACVLEGVRFVGIERDADSHATALSRISDYAFASGLERPETS